MDRDRYIVKQVLAGKPGAFRELMQDHQRLVFHIVFRMISGAQDREDICQDVFLKIYQKLSTFRFRSKLSTWIGRIAYHTCLNYLEKKKVSLLNNFHENDESIFQLPAGGQTPEQGLLEQATVEILQREIQTLPPLFRTLITLFHRDGFSYHELAEVTGLPEGTVKNYLFRARKRLRERLTKKYEVEEWR